MLAKEAILPNAVHTTKQIKKYFNNTCCALPLGPIVSRLPHYSMQNPVTRTYHPFALLLKMFETQNTFTMNLTKSVVQ